jgi:hypothetical protein
MEKGVGGGAQAQACGGQRVGVQGSDSLLLLEVQVAELQPSVYIRVEREKNKEGGERRASGEK